MSKYKINTDKKPLSESDIANNMNFDKFYSGYSAAAKTSRLTKGMKTFLGGAITTVVIVSATFIIYKSIKHKDSETAQAFINPPLPELNAKSDEFVVDNNKDTTIVYKTGTVIYVPANSFKTKDGSDAKKKVKVRYREFHDQVDQIFSGIPMNYDSAGIVRPFESAGMFEVLAFEDDSIPVYLKDGKTLKVNLMSYNDENKFNVYYLDTVAKKWDLDEQQSRKHRSDLDKLSKEKEEFLAKHGLLDPNKLIIPKKANVELNNFTIDYDKEEFPELAVYDGVKFEVSTSDANYTNEFKSTVWEDVFISRHPDGKNYILTFKINKQSTSITAAPVFDGKNYEQAMNEYGRIRLHHSKMVQAKADSLSALEKNLNAKADDVNSINERFGAFVRSGCVYRGIVISRLGITNFDCPINMSMVYKKEKNKEGFPPAHFVSAVDGKLLEPYGIYLVTRDINAIFPLGIEGVREFPVNFASTADILIVITTDQKVMFIKDQDLKKSIPNSSDITFKLKEIVCEGINKKSFDLQKIKDAIDI
jgi:hypothetical protein